MSKHPPNATPQWDAERAAWLLGRQVLVGVTHLAPNGKSVVGKEQFLGLIMAATEGVGVQVVCLTGDNEGKTVMLPPVTAAYQNAKPGTYKLKSTGQVIINPEVTVSWTVTQKSMTS